MTTDLYLDWAATTPPDPQNIAEAQERAARLWANPSSMHSPGRQARASLEEARARFARAVAMRNEAANSHSGAIVFTASGTEADHIPLLAVLRAHVGGLRKKTHIIVSDIEHAAIHAQARLLAQLGIDVSFVQPDQQGFVSPQRIGESLRKETALVAVMAVNNETGAVQDIKAIGQNIRDAAASLAMRSLPAFHCDAVQALGKIPLGGGQDSARLALFGCPELSSAAFSSHKIQGLKGTGALWLRTRIDVLAEGGAQEGGIRSGTENLLGAWSMALAAERASAQFDEHKAHALALEAALFAGLATISGASALPSTRRPGDCRYSPYIVSLAFPSLSGEVLARALADEGIAVSTGSACSQGKAGKGGKKSRRIFEAMGLPPELALTALRISTGPGTSLADIERFIDRASTLYRRLKT